MKIPELTNLANLQRLVERGFGEWAQEEKHPTVRTVKGCIIRLRPDLPGLPVKTKMDWAQHAIDALAKGEQCQIRPRGKSMSGRVEDGQVVTLIPCNPKDLKVDDIVLVRIKGSTYLHLIKDIHTLDSKSKSRYKIGNNRGGINGWVGGDAIYGQATQIEDYKEEQ